MGVREFAAAIQQSVDRLIHNDSDSEKKLEVRGARAVFCKKVYHKGNTNTPVDLQELDTDHQRPSNVEHRVKAILNEWASREKPTSLMSEDLLVHLNLPVRDCPRNCWLFQALVLGENLPFILLTLYDGDSVDSNPDGQDIANFAMRCARLLTSQLLSYCKKDFILLPCTLEYRGFDVQGLSKEVEGQKCRAAEFYRGPTSLRKESYEQIWTAVRILATTSDVPYFFEESPDAGKKLLLGDLQGDHVLRQIISYLRRGRRADNSQTPTVVYTNKTRAVKMILLEAAKRLSYFHRMIVITDDAQVKKCVKKLAQNTQEEFGLDPFWFRSVSPEDYEPSKHITGKDRTALSDDADRTNRRTSSSQLAGRHHKEPATHQKETRATVTPFGKAGFSTATTKESISEKLAPNKETDAVCGLNEEVKSEKSPPNRAPPLIDITTATETDAREEKDSAGRIPKKDTEKPRDLIEPSSDDIASDELTYSADGTATEEKSSDDPTLKKIKIHGKESIEMGQRKDNSDVMMNLETSRKGGKAVGMEDFSLVTYVIAIDTPECPTDCHLRLQISGIDRLPRCRVLLVGKSGSGKSSTANTLLGHGTDPFHAAVSFSAVTRGSKIGERQYGDLVLEVVETPGVFDLSGSFPDWPFLHFHEPQIFDVVCLVIRIGRFTEEEARVIERIQLVLGTDFAGHTIIIFTGADTLGGQDFKAILDQAPRRLGNLLDKCGRRYGVFDNTDPSDRDQVNQFLKSVRALKENSIGFRCPTYAEMERRWECARSEDLERKKGEITFWNDCHNSKPQTSPTVAVKS